jgi:Flp pilus assembly pilin Flp
MPHTRRTHITPLDERGQTMTEYALLISLIAVLVIVAFPAVVTSLQSFFSTAAGAF